VERLVFHIHAMDHETVALVKKSLQAKLEELMETRIVKSDIVARVGGKCERKILDLESDQVRIEIGTTVDT
jgi:hypothetical protein